MMSMMLSEDDDVEEVVKCASCKNVKLLTVCRRAGQDIGKGRKPCRQGRVLYRSRERIDCKRGEVLDKQAGTPSDARLILHKRSEAAERSGGPTWYEM